MEYVLVICTLRNEKEPVLFKLKNDYRYGIKKGDLVTFEDDTRLFEVKNHNGYYTEDELAFYKDLYGNRPIREISKVYKLKEVEN